MMSDFQVPSQANASRVSLNQRQKGLRRSHSGLASHCSTNVHLYSPQVDHKLLDAPSGQGAGGWALTSDRRVLADLRADSLSAMPPDGTPGGRKIASLSLQCYRWVG
ncbi:hypothetical protein PoB_004860400 [Plakobranchus ocellatus]|uniref:Uncharacterized protein n=1 Tax=Plakobranchus ocellatus TaxID=259542 RepID=A0AAV4BPR2_9GAST|nr:hypothetical protein PoB_004860400 [Plakobranchus ocellatus]